MSGEQAWIGYGGIALIALGLGGALLFELVVPNSLLRTASARYMAVLEREIRFLFYKVTPSAIVTWQVLGAVVVACVAFLLQMSFLLYTLPVIAVAPVLSLAARHRERVTKIETQLDSWLLLLANALKPAPSLGEAMSASARIVRPPIQQEIDLCLKEIQLGTPLDRAVISMSNRIGSATFAGAMTTILVGRQTGGNLPRILEESAATLREMARLEGVVRTKTAEGKSQAIVLAVIPFVLISAIQYIDPHWLVPLTTTAAGYGVMIIATVLWVAAIWLARRILAVDI